MRSDEPVRPKRPAYFTDGSPPVKKANWKKHEKDVAERSGARQVAGSGNQPGKPGDLRGAKFLRECKASKGAGLSVQAKWLRKLVDEATQLGRYPLVEIRLEAAEAPVPTDWVMLPALDFQELLERGE